MLSEASIFFCFYFCLPLNNACFHCSQAQSDLFRISVNLLMLTFKHDLSRTTLRLGNIFRGNILRTLYGAQVFWGLSTWLVATKLLPLLATGLFLLFLSSNVLFDFKWLLSYMCRSVTAENSRGYFYRLLKCILSLFFSLPVPFLPLFYTTLHPANSDLGFTVLWNLSAQLSFVVVLLSMLLLQNFL